MEVSAGEDYRGALLRRAGLETCPYIIRGNENQGVVHRRIGFDLENFAAVCQRVSYRAVYLGNAAQRICILHAAAFAMRFANLAAFEHSPQVCCGFNLSCMRTRAMDALV